MKRQQYKKRKKRKWLGISFLLLALLIGIGAFYWVDQFKQGQSLAGDSTLKEQSSEFDLFEGPEPQYGEINVLLLGSDARANENGGRSDTLMVAHYAQKTGALKLISIMRDTYVDIPGYGKQKMNAAFSLGGPELVRQTIKENFGLDVHYYTIVDFNGFPKLVDILAPDGIEVDIPYKMQHGIGMTLQPGQQTLHGDELLGYVRFRHDRMSDFGRVERQQEALSKLKEEAVGMHNIMNLPKLLGAAEAYIDTNVDKMTMLSIAKGLLDKKSNGIETLRIPVDHSYRDLETNVGDVLDIDFQQNIDALNAFLKGSTETAENTSTLDEQ
ncbi:transcriptional regulator [Bacillus sp. OxB-1]|uniref:LCP family protein n=1 Tax=Bacillus sp. (strain OxB-1) TaxID=98228 RepID=UPI000581CDD3|nr:LCP family protein [Bacillus sp. OxB-1]BAQ10749.1 transcriptional regulator [Bacillus sp. OxB-1]